LTAKTSVKLKGESGIVTIIAPFPALDYVELPLTFVAITFAKTLDPQGKLYGKDRKTETGILQNPVDTTEDETGLQ
jgi:hypothetical protein